MAKLALVLLCAAFGLAAARQLHQATELATAIELPKDLLQLNARFAAAAAGKVSPFSLLDSYEDYEAKYGPDTYGPSHKNPRYETTYETPKYEQHEYNTPSYEEPQYNTPKYDETKYEEETKYGAPKYENKYEDKYESKYEKKYEPEYEKESMDKYAPAEHDKYGNKYEDGYSYGPAKVTLKLYEKFRSMPRFQEGNDHTFQFTSELTCQDPSAIHDIEMKEGVIVMPLVPDRMKMPSVGVCEWTVTLVKPHVISEHAKLKGNTQVICRFNEEAERHCKSASGLVYNFDKIPGYESAPGEKYAELQSADKKKVVPEAPEAPEIVEAGSMDVYLSLINGVINQKTHTKWDNGALQYFYGEPKAQTGVFSHKQKGNPAGQYTMVFQ